MSFEERAHIMGLNNLGDGCFYYTDRYGEVIYRTLVTRTGSQTDFSDEFEVLDNFEVPYLALFTRKQGDQRFKLVGILSDLYKFIGNDALNQKIRDPINETGNLILTEQPVFSSNFTQMYNMIVIQNASNVPRVGDVFPTIIIRNSYNGTKRAFIDFGISMLEVDSLSTRWIGFGFRTKLGNISQVHIDSSTTLVSTAVGNYVSVFSQNILLLVESNFNNLLSEDDVLRVLDLVEEIGKKRREGISSILEELSSDSPTKSSWNMFLAITKFSSREKNLNAKVLLENIAERVLIVPAQMMSFI